MTTYKPDSGAIADAMIAESAENMKPDHVATWPSTIYLVNGCDETPTYYQASSSNEVTWCADRIEPGDVQYVRMDLVDADYADLEAKLAAAEARMDGMMLVPIRPTTEHLMPFIKHCCESVEQVKSAWAEMAGAGDQPVVAQDAAQPLTPEWVGVINMANKAYVKGGM